MIVEPAALMLLMLLLGIFIGIIGILAYQHSQKPKVKDNEIEIIPPGSLIYQKIDGKFYYAESLAE